MTDASFPMLGITFLRGAWANPTDGSNCSPLPEWRNDRRTCTSASRAVRTNGFALLFRDFMRANDDARDAWGLFKIELAKIAPTVQDYVEVKDSATDVRDGRRRTLGGLTRRVWTPARRDLTLPGTSRSSGALTTDPTSPQPSSALHISAPAYDGRRETKEVDDASRDGDRADRAGRAAERRDRRGGVQRR
jgi:hypothetical protein